MAIVRVLLAEDDPQIRRVLEVALRRDGFVVKTANDGIEVFTALEASSDVDVIVLDGMMPRLDGLETCRRLKADPQTAHIPVIMLSARSQNTDEQAAQDVGACGFIRKPFDALSLGQQIRRICAEQQIPEESVA